MVDNYSEISNIKVNINELASHRKLAVGTAPDTREEDSLWNKILFCKYAMDHFNCFGEAIQENEKGLKYELEYLVGGKSSDNQNLEIVIGEILLIREIDNYLLLLQNEVKKLEAHEIAAVVTAALVPWLEPVVYQAILVYWAYEESVQDLQALFRGEKVPLVKSLPLDMVSEFTLEYQEYLLVLLLLQRQDNLVMRSIDMIEVSLRKKDATFQMDACIGQACLMGEFYDRYDKKYTIFGKIQYY